MTTRPTPDLRAVAEAYAVESAAAQGLPVQITDPGVLGRVATLIKAGEPRKQVAS